MSAASAAACVHYQGVAVIADGPSRCRPPRFPPRGGDEEVRRRWVVRCTRAANAPSTPCSGGAAGSPWQRAARVIVLAPTAALGALRAPGALVPPHRAVRAGSSSGSADPSSKTPVARSPCRGF